MKNSLIAGSSEVVHVRRSYRFPVEKVYAAWTRPEALEKWFGPPGFTARVITHELKIGGSWKFLMESETGQAFHHFGEFIEIYPNEKLVFTWESEDQAEIWKGKDGGATLVTVSFHEKGDLVKVAVTHERLTSYQAVDALTQGWGGSLERLLPYMESEPKS